MTTKKKTPKQDTGLTVIAGGATILHLSDKARAQIVDDNIFDIYAALPRQVPILNSAVMNAPVDLELTLDGCMALVLSHPSTAGKQLIFPTLGTVALPPGKHIIDRLTITNHDGRAQYISDETPIARVVLVPYGNFETVLYEYEQPEEPEAA